MNAYFACDLGTTTVDLAIIDKNNKLISERHFKNRQSLYGADVISRIKSAGRSETLVAMRNMIKCDILSSLEEMLDALDDETEKKLSGGVICGNTTMIALLAGFETESLGVYPFRTPFVRSFQRSVDELFGDLENTILDGLLKKNYVNRNISILLSGCASAFIGGDVLAGVLALSEEGRWSDERISLLIDLGTNGEIVLNSKGTMLATSAACGPAFEGCVRRQGVYGATLLDAIALGRRSGRILDNGALGDMGTVLMSPRIKGTKEPSPCLDINGVRIDSEILRAVLLAKAAIRAGIETLLSHAGISAEQVDSVYVAGGFGFYLNVETAIYLGLFPAEFAGKLQTVGNTSLAGARLLALKSSLINLLDKLCEEKVQVLQAANDDHYQDLLLSFMRF